MNKIFIDNKNEMKSNGNSGVFLTMHISSENNDKLNVLVSSKKFNYEYAELRKTIK